MTDVVQKFRKFLERLSYDEQRDLYDILCMLRGPDIENSTLKTLITARIRYILGFHPCKTTKIHVFQPATNSTPFPPYSEIIDELNRQRFENDDNWHYCSHAKEAISRLYELGYVPELPDECGGDKNAF